MLQNISAETYINEILTAYRIRHLIINTDSDNKSDIDLNYRGRLFSDFNYEKFFFAVTENAKENLTIEYQDEYKLNFFVFTERNKDAISYHICGPYFYELPFAKNDYNSFVDFVISCKIPNYLFKQVRAFFLSIPIINDMISFKALLRNALMHYFNENVLIERHYANEKNLQNPAFANKVRLNYDTLEARYATERKLLNAITAGDTANALKYHNEFMKFKFEKRAANEILNVKQYIIAANTAFRKAAEAAQVHPLYIDELNGKITLDIEAANTISDLNHLNITMVRKYCLLVKTYSRENYSEIVRNCLNYIDFHYQDKLSLTFFAEKYMISKNYLSTLFHNEVGKTLTDYINETRIRKAILLLNSTSYSIETISEQCGFSDANYFTRTFKKIQGMTPIHYRKTIQNK